VLKILHEVRVNIWDLLVEDGWIAGGTLGAFIATGLLPFLITGPMVADIQGPFLLVLLMGLLLVNLYGVGRRLRGSIHQHE
jgi:hypothetical protein